MPATDHIEIQDIPIDSLRLDPENPRLAGMDSGKSNDQLLEQLWAEMAVDEVALSIAENGFWEEEPLFVVPVKAARKDPKKDLFYVVEGNRRLSAVLLLLNEELRKKIKATGLPEISEERKKQLQTLPCSIYESRKDLWEFFGFRHINGPKAWDAFSKGQYVAKVHEEYGVDLETLSRKIGDRHDFVKRIYRGYVLVKQAESAVGFSQEDIDARKFSFSHLYTAAAQPEFQKFLGITAEKSLHKDPVPNSHLENLKDLMIWLYGRKSAKVKPIVVTQNPDLNTLREVLSRSASLKALKAGLSLRSAYDIALGDRRRFEDALTRAKQQLLVANGAVTTGYEGEEESFEQIQEILKLTQNISKAMEAVRTKTGAK